MEWHVALGGIKLQAMRVAKHAHQQRCLLPSWPTDLCFLTSLCALFVFVRRSMHQPNSFLQGLYALFVFVQQSMHQPNSHNQLLSHAYMHCVCS